MQCHRRQNGVVEEARDTIHNLLRLVNHFTKHQAHAYIQVWVSKFRLNIKLAYQGLPENIIPAVETRYDRRFLC